MAAKTKAKPKAPEPVVVSADRTDQPDFDYPIGEDKPAKPTYDERVAADLAKQAEASAKLARVRRLEQQG